MEIYTDGACVPNPGRGAWAFVVVEGRNYISHTAGYARSTTNNRMEMEAVIGALEYLKNIGEQNITIYSDSIYVIDGITSWIKKWVKNGFKRKRKDIKNKDLWIKMYYLYKDMNPNFELVKGHSENYFNELADSLCDAEISAYS